MRSRQTWFWLCLALGLFAYIFFYHRHMRGVGTGPVSILPHLRAGKVTQVQVRPQQQLEIRAERTNGGWVLTSPLAGPAQAVGIENLLTVLERVYPAAHISGQELMNRPNADAEFGFLNPYASVIVQQHDQRFHLLVGTRTAPGDQVFLQVVGKDGAYVVDAEFLQYLPRSVDDWRDTTLLNLKTLAFDRLTVTNSGRMFELRRDTNQLWRMTLPIQARAGQDRIVECLEMLENLRIQRFVSDDPKADLEGYGLQAADLQLSFRQGTNPVATLLFGHAVTNDPGLVYARRVGQDSVCAVSRELLTPWRAPVNEFRDPFLVSVTGLVSVIECRGVDAFSLAPTNGQWRVWPRNFPADSNTVSYLLGALNRMQIVQFVKDVVTDQDLPAYGLSDPALRFRLLAPAGAGAPETVRAEVCFGTNQDTRVFARRADESSVFAVKLEDVQRLPQASWQFRETAIWNFAVSNVARINIRQQGKTRQILRNGPHDWSLAPGSQGIINDLAIEETVKGLSTLAAVEWIAQGTALRERLGFTPQGHVIELELKNGEKLALEFGGAEPGAHPFATVTLENQPWIFRFPFLLHRDIQSYLSVPPDGS